MPDVFEDQLRQRLHTGSASDPSSPDLRAPVMNRIRRERRLQRRLRWTVSACMLLAILGARELRQLQQPPGGRIPLAAQNGIGWLVEQQADDGSWNPADTGGSPHFTQGVTACALLAMLHAPNQYPQVAIERAADYLTACLGKDAANLDGPTATYNHLLAMEALVSLEAMSPNGRRRDLLRQSLHAWSKRQQPSGGWDYAQAQAIGYANDRSTHANLAVTWWSAQLLRDARLLQVLDTRETLQRAEVYLSARLVPGQSHYVPGEVAGSDSALYWMALGMAGSTATSADFLPTVQKTTDRYRDWFASRQTPSYSSDWFDFRLALADQQQGNGSWPLQDRWSAAGGRVYTTALAVLALAPGA